MIKLVQREFRKKSLLFFYPNFQQFYFLIPIGYWTCKKMMQSPVDDNLVVFTGKLKK